MRWGSSKRQGGPNELSNSSQETPKANNLTQAKAVVVPEGHEDEVASLEDKSSSPLTEATTSVRSSSLDIDTDTDTDTMNMNMNMNMHMSSININTVNQNVITSMNKIDSLEESISDLKSSFVNNNTELSEKIIGKGFSEQRNVVRLERNASLQQHSNDNDNGNNDKKMKSIPITVENLPLSHENQTCEQQSNFELKALSDKTELLDKQVSELKCSMNKIQSFQETVSQWKADIDTTNAIQNGKMNALEQSVSDLKTHVDAWKGEARHYNKMQTLAWALENAHLGSFKYHNYQFDEPYVTSSKDYAQSVLMSFRMGLGQIIGPHYMVDEEGNDNEEQFRQEISNQIHMLTGVRPRINREDDGNYAISYS